MSRAPRWWRPAPQRNVRPAVRATRRRQAGQDVGDVFEIGYEAGREDEAKRSRQRDGQLRRLVDAADAAEQGDMGPLDDFLAVADAAGATPLPDVDGGQLVDELEAWLHGQEGDG